MRRHFSLADESLFELAGSCPNLRTLRLTGGGYNADGNCNAAFYESVAFLLFFFVFFFFVPIGSSFCAVLTLAHFSPHRVSWLYTNFPAGLHAIAQQCTALEHLALLNYPAFEWPSAVRRLSLLLLTFCAVQRP